MYPENMHERSSLRMRSHFEPYKLFHSNKETIELFITLPRATYIYKAAMQVLTVLLCNAYDVVLHCTNKQIQPVGQCYIRLATLTQSQLIQ